MVSNRQGDVMLVEIAQLPAGEQIEIPRDARGRLVLAEGEVTGHAHVILEPGVRLVEIHGARFLEAQNEFTVRHEEHSLMPLTGKLYALPVQVNYQRKQAQRVLD